MTQLINLTPHTINVQLENGERIAFPSQGNARVSVKNVSDGEINGIPVSRPIYGEVEGLPDPQDGTVYIVSMLVAQRSPGRSDLVGPDSGPSAIRENGLIVAVRGFSRL